MSRERKLPPYSDDEIAADPDLAAALLSDAGSLLAIEQQMKALREQKADLFDDLRQSRFKPEFAKAWVATQMVDEEKDAARAEKEMVLARVVSAMDAVKGAKARARAGVRSREEKPAPRQEEIVDAETGEITEAHPAVVAEVQALADMGISIEIARATGVDLPKANEPDPIRHLQAAVASVQQPYRITPSTPAPEPVDPDASPLIADPVARQEQARRLLERQQVAG